MNEQKKIEFINSQLGHTLMQHLGIVFTKVGADFVEATMPVDARTVNPMQILHGGASMALAESVGSGLAFMLIDAKQFEVRGVEINGNHLKAVSKGFVTARATTIHKGKTTHVCEIKITDSEGNLVNISRMTNMIIPKTE